MEQLRARRLRETWYEELPIPLLPILMIPFPATRLRMLRDLVLRDRMLRDGTRSLFETARVSRRARAPKGRQSSDTVLYSGEEDGRNYSR